MLKKIDFDITATEADALSRLMWLTERDIGLIDGEMAPFEIKPYNGHVKGEPRSRFDMPSLTYDGIEVAKPGFVNKTGFALVMEGLPEQVEIALKSRLRRMVRSAQAGMKVYREEKRVLEKIIKTFLSNYCDKETFDDVYRHGITMSHKYPDDLYNALIGVLLDQAVTRIFHQDYDEGSVFVKEVRNEMLDISEELFSISFKSYYSPKLLVKPYAGLSNNEMSELLDDGRKVFLANLNKDLITHDLERLPADNQWEDNNVELFKLKQLAAKKDVLSQGPFRFIRIIGSRDVIGILLHGDVAIGSVSSTQAYKVTPHGVTKSMLKDVPDLETKLRTTLKMSLGVFSQPEVVVDKEEQKRLWLQDMESAVRNSDAGYDI